MLVVKHHVATKLPILEIENEMVIFEQGDEDFTLYFVLEGSVSLYVQKITGEQEVAHIKKNEFFGESELYTQSARTVSAKTTSPTKLVTIKTTAEFEKFVTENRFLSGKIMENMSTKLAEINAILATKKLTNTQTNVVLEAAKEYPSGKNGGDRRIIRH
jgi:CRP-like cAMP-binding protein